MVPQFYCFIFKLSWYFFGEFCLALVFQVSEVNKTRIHKNGNKSYQIEFNTVCNKVPWINCYEKFLPSFWCLNKLELSGWTDAFATNFKLFYTISVLVHTRNVYRKPFIVEFWFIRSLLQNHPFTLTLHQLNQQSTVTHSDSEIKKTSLKNIWAWKPKSRILALRKWFLESTLGLIMTSGLMKQISFDKKPKREHKSSPSTPSIM